MKKEINRIFKLLIISNLNNLIDVEENLVYRDIYQEYRNKLKCKQKVQK